METPKESHWLAAKRILRYIKGTLNVGLFYTYGEAAELVGYSDSDWGGTKMRGKSPLDMSSILGQLHFYGPQRNKELCLYLHAKQSMWQLHLLYVKLFGCGTF